MASEEIDRDELKRALRQMNRSYKVPKGLNLYVPGRKEELRKEYVRRRKWESAESKVPFSILIEITYILCLFLCACVAVVYFCISLTLLGWGPSIQSITVNITVAVGKSTFHYNMLEENGFDMRTWCIYYLMLSIYLLGISVVPMWYAGFQGRQEWLNMVRVLTIFFLFIILPFGSKVLINHFIIIILELYTVLYAFFILPSSCNLKIFTDELTRLFKWYGILSIHKDNHGHEAMDKINEMQAAMGCCGINGYKDYGKLFVTQNDSNFDLDWFPKTIEVRDDYERKDLKYYLQFGREITQIPHSCCRPVWKHNIYCADDIFELEKQTNSSKLAEYRLNPKGCIEVVGGNCENLRYLLTMGMFYTLVTKLTLFVSLVALTVFIKRSINFLTQTLFSLTEGRAGRRYTRMATTPLDLNMDIIRYPYDRFDPKVYKWVDARDTNKEIPRRNIPISNLLRINEMEEPGIHEKNQLQEKLSTMAGKEVYFGNDADPNMTNQEYYDSINQSTSIKRKVRAEQAREISQKLFKNRDSPQVVAKKRAALPNKIDKPEKYRLPPVRSIYEKEPKIYTDDIEQVEIPEDMTDQQKVILFTQRELAKKYDWEEDVKVKKRRSKYSNLPEVAMKRSLDTSVTVKLKKTPAEIANQYHKWRTFVTSKALKVTEETNQAQGALDGIDKSDPSKKIVKETPIEIVKHPPSPAPKKKYRKKNIKIETIPLPEVVEQNEKKYETGRDHKPEKVPLSDTQRGEKKGEQVGMSKATQVDHEKTHAAAALLHPKKLTPEKVIKEIKTPLPLTPPKEHEIKKIVPEKARVGTRPKQEKVSKKEVKTPPPSPLPWDSLKDVTLPPIQEPESHAHDNGKLKSVKVGKGRKHRSPHHRTGHERNESPTEGKKRRLGKVKPANKRLKVLAKRKSWVKHFGHIERTPPFIE